MAGEAQTLLRLPGLGTMPGPQAVIFGVGESHAEKVFVTLPCSGEISIGTYNMVIFSQDGYVQS
jgi:hypothetical protein